MRDLRMIEDICSQNDVAEVFFIIDIDRSDLCFSFYSMSGDGSDVHRCSKSVHPFMISATIESW